MSESASTVNRGAKRRQNYKPKTRAPSKPVSCPPEPINSSPALRNGSILAEIKQHLESVTPNPQQDDACNDLGSTPQGNPSLSSPLRCCDDARTMVKLSFSSSSSDSTLSSDTLTASPLTKTDIMECSVMEGTITKEETDHRVYDQMCQITDLSKGRCRHGDKCGRLHILGKGVPAAIRRQNHVDMISGKEVDRSDGPLFNKGKENDLESVDLPGDARVKDDALRTGHCKANSSCASSMESGSSFSALKQTLCMQSSMPDDSEPQHSPGPIVKSPPAAKTSDVALPLRPCLDWQAGRCFRQNCKFSHVKISPQDYQSMPPGQATKPTCDSLSPSRTNSATPDGLNGRIIGYCWNWLLGRCRYGNRCKYKHALPPNKTTIIVPPPVSLRTTDTHRPSPSSQGHADTMNNRTCLPVKQGCKFCAFGLCRDVHRTLESFILPESKVPQPSFSSILSESIPLIADDPQSINLNGPKLGSLAAKSFIGPEELSVILLKSTRVKIGRGMQILNVSTAFESNVVGLGNLPEQFTESDLRNIGEPFGEVLEVELPAHVREKGKLGKLVYASHTEAALAIAALNGSMQFFTKITAKPYNLIPSRETGRLSACIVRVDIPSPGIVAFAGYETSEHAENAIKAMHGSSVKNNANVVAAHLHHSIPKAGPFTVRFEGLPYHFTEKHIRSFGAGRKNPTAGVILLQKGSYQSLVDVTRVLHNIFEEYGSVISFDLSHAIPCNGRICGIVRFASVAGAAAACRALNGRRFNFLGSEKIYLQHLRKMSYKIPVDIRNALRLELDRLSSFARGQPGVQLIFSDPSPEKVEIDISASHLDSLKRVKAPLERLISGVTLEEQGKAVWNNFFATASGMKFIESVSRQTRTHIRSNHARCYVKLWGTGGAVAQARELLLNELRRIQATHCYALPLTGKVLMQLLFNSLDAIHKKVGKEAAYLHFGERELIIRGTEEDFLWIVEYLGKKSGTLPSVASAKRKTNVSDVRGPCPICLDDVLDGISLDCGHSACKECLVRYLASACDHKVFPLKCLGNDNQCTELLPLPLCQGILQKDQFARLVDASFFTYIQTRPQEFHYCPTPDCPQIYRDAPGTILQCPTCLVSICPSCHEVQHDWVECRVTNEAGNRLFNEWREQHNVKTCPGCSANIEKIAGCNHLTCAKCSTHICWECLATFRESGEVYEHMMKTHGGIGL